MAKPISGKLEGLSKFKSVLNKYGKLIAKDVDSSLNQAAKSITSDAKGRCIISEIASTISFSKVENGYQVTTHGEHSAYLEFGTGNFAKVLLGSYPQEWKDMAMNFYINGLGRTPAAPYLYPAYQENAGEAVIKIIEKIEGH